MKKNVIGSVLLLISGAAVYGLLQLDFVARHVTPKRFWKSKIYQYQRELERTRQVELIKKIQLKKKIITGELDVAQDMVLGISRDISIAAVQSEIEQLKESVADSQRAEHQIELQLAEAREKFNAD